MKRLFGLILLAIISLTPYARSQGKSGPKSDNWTSTSAQKIAGLATIWAEAKYAFPSFAQVPNLNWDQCFQDFIPKVVAAKDKDAYYWTLMEFAGLLKDGHTSVLPPWGYLRPDYDNPPLEVRIIKDEFIVARAANTPELKARGIRAGLEILEINNMKANLFFQDRINRYYPRGSTHANNALNVVYLLRGPRDSKVKLKVQDEDGKSRVVNLTRNSMLASGRPFLPRVLLWMMADSPMETRRMDGNIQYIRLANFQHPEMADQFLQLIDSLDSGTTKGLIFDLRFCLGGNSKIAEKMIGALIDAPVSSPHWKYPCYSAAEKNWGHPLEWRTESKMIPPRNGKRFSGPIVILTAGTASSTAEDFMISLREANRVRLVGERTAGSAGNPISLSLPGGGKFEMATFRAILPDGKEYVGTGLKPDIEIEPTRNDIRNGVDNVLNMGMKVLANWDSYRK